jgi:alpha-N-arabinofuranosidase
VVVGSLMISLLKHADRVKIGCLAQLVNVIAPIRSEPGGPSWRQSTFYPFALTSANGRGTVLHTTPRGSTHETKWLGEVPVVDLVPVQHDDGTVAVFAVNRSQTEPATVDLDVRGFSGAVRGEHVALFDDDPDAANSAEQPDRVTPRQLDTVTADAGTLSVVLPPLSWNMLTLRPAS